MRKPQSKIKNENLARRLRRKLTTRKTLIGTATKPRACVTKTNKHLRVQLIDDTTGRTLLTTQSYGKNAVSGSGKSKEGAKVLGAAMAENMKGQNITTAVFDRSGHTFGGVLASLANSLRENGISI